MSKQIFNNVQSKYFEERCIVVDEKDKPLYPASKKNCHFIDTSMFWLMDSSQARCVVLKFSVAFTERQYILNFDCLNIF